MPTFKQALLRLLIGLVLIPASLALASACGEDTESSAGRTKTVTVKQEPSKPKSNLPVMMKIGDRMAERFDELSELGEKGSNSGTDMSEMCGVGVQIESLNKAN
jgi:hypothetical protein